MTAEAKKRHFDKLANFITNEVNQLRLMPVARLGPRLVAWSWQAKGPIQLATGKEVYAWQDL